MNQSDLTRSRSLGAVWTEANKRKAITDAVINNISSYLRRYVLEAKLTTGRSGSCRAGRGSNHRSGGMEV